MTLVLVAGSLLVFCVLLVPFTVLMARMTRALVTRMVERRHRELEEVVVHERLPRSWTFGSSPALALAELDVAGAVDRRTARRCRRRLDRLTSQVRRSALVADEETRHELLQRLAAVRERL